MNNSVGAPGCSCTTWESRVSPIIVCGIYQPTQARMPVLLSDRSAGRFTTCSVVRVRPGAASPAVTLPLRNNAFPIAASTAAASSFNPKLYSTCPH